MTEVQVAAAFFVPAAAIMGVCFVVFHQHISDMARQVRREHGRYVGPSTQSPGLMIVAGLGLLVGAGAFALGAFTDVFSATG